MSEPDERTHDRLYLELRRAGWGISNTMYTSYGATGTFRKGPHTSDFPGMETRDIQGKDEDDAIRMFLAEIKAES